MCHHEPGFDQDGPTTTPEQQRIARLEGEVRELREANNILRSLAYYFASVSPPRRR